MRLRRERRARQARRRRLAGCNSRGRGRWDRRVEQRRQVLELPTSRTLLEHAPAVRADAVRRAVVVGLEQPADAAEARGLEVEQAGRPRQCLDVADRVDRLVPGDPVSVAVEQLDGVVGPRRDPRSMPPARPRTRGRRGRRPAPSPPSRCGRDPSCRPRRRRRATASSASSWRSQPGRGIELETQRRDPCCARRGAGRGRRVGDPHRHDEGDGLRRSTDGVLQREAVLAQGEVERRALERPAAVIAGAVADRLDREEVGQAQQRGEFVQGAVPAQPREVAGAAEMLDLIDLIPGDVLALSFVAVTAQPDDGRDLGEPARGVARQRQELAPFDPQGQPGDACVRRPSRTREGTRSARSARPARSCRAAPRARPEPIGFRRVPPPARRDRFSRAVRPVSVRAWRPGAHCS